MATTIGVNLMPQMAPEEFIDVARYVDQAGFSHMFVADSSLHAHDVYPYLTLLALETDRATIGPLVSHPYTRHPAINLNAMATVNELAGGRAILNMAAGDRPVMELGYPLAKRKVLRETVGVMRGLMGGGMVSFEGDEFSLKDAKLRYGDISSTPLFVTASGPRMLELAGELADGVIFHAGSDLRCVEFALEHIEIGARRSGRELKELELGCALYSALDDDLDRAREACRPIGAWFPQTAPHYARLIGVADETIEKVRSVYSGGHFDESAEAFSMITDDMVDSFALAGDKRVWLEKLRQIEALGVEFIVLYAMVEDKFAMIRKVADEILPEFHQE